MNVQRYTSLLNRSSPQFVSERRLKSPDDGRSSVSDAGSGSSTEYSPLLRPTTSSVSSTGTPESPYVPYTYRSLPTSPIPLYTEVGAHRSRDDDVLHHHKQAVQRQQQPFQRNSARSSFSSVRSDSAAQRKAVSFGQAVQYDYAGLKPSFQSTPRRPINNNNNNINSNNNNNNIYNSESKYNSNNSIYGVPSSIIRSSNLPKPILSGPNRVSQQVPNHNGAGVGGGSKNGDYAYVNGLPVPRVGPSGTVGDKVYVTTAEIHSTPRAGSERAWTPTARHNKLSPIEHSRHSEMPILNELKSSDFSPASSGGTRSTDWSDVDGSGGVNGGGKRSSNRSVKREELRRHTVTGDPMIALPPTRSSSATHISNSNYPPIMHMENNMAPVLLNKNGISSSTLPKSSRSKTNKIPQENSKKDVILGHLQKKFPDYAGSIAGRKDQLVLHGSRDGKEWTKVVYSHTYTAQRSHSMYQPPASIYDDDPGIMSEAETSATGFRRGIKQRSSLPVVRTPNKSLERPLGLVFLQFRSETKRALLPNEITSLDTVKALFVRSFPHQLSMEYLESPHLRIYIHDPSKDMFYELEDLRDVKDRSVLRIYEQDVNGGAPMSTWDQDMSYFSEPEFDSEYQNQHIHRTKGSKTTPASSNYYGVAHTATTYSAAGRTATLPHHSQMVAYYSSPGYVSERNKSHTLPHPGSDIGTRTLPLPGSVHAPPKPHRSFQQQQQQQQQQLQQQQQQLQQQQQQLQQQAITSMAKSVRAISAPPQGPPPPVPSPRTNQAGTSVPCVPVFPRSVSPVRGSTHHSQPQQHPIRYITMAECSYTTQPIYPSHADHRGTVATLPDRRLEHHRSYPMYITPSSSYEDPYYSDRQYPVSLSGSVTPVMDEEARRDGYLLPANGIQTVDQLRYRARVEYMERQLASLTGLVHKALTTSRPPPIQRDIEINLSRDLLQVPLNNSVAIYKGGAGGEVCEVKSSVSSSSSPSLSDDFKPESKTIPRPLSKEEKSVSFSDDPPTMSSPTHAKQHSPQHTVERPTKPALKTSTLPRAYSSDRENRQSGKPAPPPKPSSLGGSSHDGKLVHQLSGRDIQITPEMYNQLRVLKKKTKDLKVEVRNLRRITQAQAMNIKETIREAFVKIKAMLAASESGDDQVRTERNRVSREEEMYRQDIAQLENSLSDLEAAVEELRSNVINRRCRVNMSEVENMALVLSKASKTVADLKGRYPSLQENLKSVMAAEMEVIIREERFLKEEPERLENALRRCKKLTGTLVTLKRLASVQEQRLPPTSPGLEHGRAASLPSSASLNEQQLDEITIGPDGQFTKAASFSGDVSRQSSISVDGCSSQSSMKSEHALDALLDELQTSAVGPPLATILKQTQNETKSGQGSSNQIPPKRYSSLSSTDSPLRGQVVSQGPAGVVTLNVSSAPVSKLQVNDGGSRQSVNLSPSLSPVPQSSIDGKTSPQPSDFRNLKPHSVDGAPSEGNIKSPTSNPPTSSNATTASVQSVATTVGQLVKKVPPPPPPRTSSKSPLVSPTSPMSPAVALGVGGGRYPPTAHRSYSLQVTPSNVPPEVPARPSSENRKTLLEAVSGGRRAVSLNGDLLSDRDGSVLRTLAISEENLIPCDQLSSNSSSSESVNSQEGLSQKLASKSNSLDGDPGCVIGSVSSLKSSLTPPTPPTRNRQEILEQRHQELLRRQRQLQEQYVRLQQMQRGQTLHRFSPPRSPAAPPADLKKTGSESNILSKAGLAMSAVTSGSLTHLAPASLPNSTNAGKPVANNVAVSSPITNKIYETDIL